MGFTLHADPGFSLAAASAFARGFPGTLTDADAEGMSFAWAVDGLWSTVRVTLRQSGAQVHGDIVGGTAPSSRALTMAVRRDVERILCLDVDGAGFTALADPVVTRLQAQLPGLRPVLFYTPYEAAAWTIIGHRIQMAQAARIKDAMARDLGEDDAFPAPERLARLTAPWPGLTERKVDQLRRLAAAADEGRLDRDRLRGLDVDEATAQLQELAGIGPFSAELILIRGVGSPDAMPHHERRLERAVRAAYDLPDDADDATVAAVAEGWRPYRSWVSLLLRAAT